MLIVLLVLVLVFVLFQLGVVVVGGRLSTPPYRGEVSDHFNGKTFFHPWKKPKDTTTKGFRDVLKWQLQRREKAVWQRVDNIPGPRPPECVMGKDLRVTFIGHSTILIQTEGLNIITDPVLSERASPFAFIGPKRFRNPGIRFEDIPKIDLILLSHNHYDHADERTLRALGKRDDPRIITTLGVSLFLAQKGMTNAVELDWWQSHKINDEITIHAVPAQHFSSRGTRDRNTSLWCGFVIETPNGNIYFAGDSGYAPTFAEIGKRFGSMRASFIPIGAYRPRWFMSGVHVDPHEAVQIHRDVNSKHSIGIHWGTFKLTDEGMDDPPKDLLHALRNAEISEKEFVTLQEGKSVIIE